MRCNTTLPTLPTLPYICVYAYVCVEIFNSDWKQVNPSELCRTLGGSRWLKTPPPPLKHAHIHARTHRNTHTLTHSLHWQGALFPLVLPALPKPC